MAGGIVVSKFDRIGGRRAGDGMGHVHGEGLILRAKSAECRLQLRGCGEGGELPGEDVRRNTRQRDEEHDRGKSHQQVRDDQTVAHLPQHLVDQPAVQDDAS